LRTHCPSLLVQARDHRPLARPSRSMAASWSVWRMPAPRPPVSDFDFTSRKRQKPGLPPRYPLLEAVRAGRDRFGPTGAVLAAGCRVLGIVAPLGIGMFVRITGTNWLSTVKVDFEPADVLVTALGPSAVSRLPAVRRLPLALSDRGRRRGSTGRHWNRHATCVCRAGCPLRLPFWQIARSSRPAEIRKYLIHLTREKHLASSCVSSKGWHVQQGSNLPG
jgi:hypothetical protein